MARRSLPAGCPGPGETADQSSGAVDAWLLIANLLLPKSGILKKAIRTLENVEWSLLHVLLPVTPSLVSSIYMTKGANMCAVYITAANSNVLLI